ncbi:MAG: hypothetical protein JMDDDDMK_02445 [Acidobacteria bacterium]|nr:hypothetical protein [Acidobacteriota bacterium]
MEKRADTVPIVGPAFGNDVDDAARGMAELGFVAGRQHLKFGDRLLVELRRRAARQRVFVRHPVNQVIGVAAAISEHRRGLIAVRIGLPVERDAGHELEQVEVVAPIDRQLDDLARRNRAARARCVRFEQRRFASYRHRVADRPCFERDIEGDSAVERHLQFLELASGETSLRNQDFVIARRQSRQPIEPLAAGRHIAFRGERRAAYLNLRARDRRALRVFDYAFNRGRGLGHDRERRSAERQAEKTHSSSQVFHCLCLQSKVRNTARSPVNGNLREPVIGVVRLSRLCVSHFYNNGGNQVKENLQYILQI